MARVAAVAAEVWNATELPRDAAALAARAGLDHPMIALLSWTDRTLDGLLAGRLARVGHPDAALDLVDDMLEPVAA